MNSEKTLVCAKHDTYTNDEARFLPAAYAAKYNHCIECAIHSRLMETGGGFTQEEVGLLLDETKGNIYQIEQKAIAKLAARARRDKVLATAIASLATHSDEKEDLEEVRVADDEYGTVASLLERLGETVGDFSTNFDSDPEIFYPSTDLLINSSDE